MKLRWTDLWRLGLFAVACGGDKDNLIYDCEGEFTSPSGWLLEEDYQFMASNFSCQDDPVLPEFEINLSSFDGGVYVGSAGIHDVFTAGANKWNDNLTLGGCMTIRIASATSDDVRYQEDYTSAILMQTGYYDLDPFSLMRTRLQYDAASPELGAISCDTRAFTERFSSSSGDYVSILWDKDDSESVGDPVDFAMPTVAGHEFGHCLGLNDNDNSSSIMFNDSVASTSFLPSALDVEAVDFLYCDYEWE